MSRLYVEILVNDCQQEKEDTEETHTFVIFGFPVIISARRSHSYRRQMMGSRFAARLAG